MIKVTLVIKTGKHAGEVIPVARKQFIIGRHRKCHMRVSSIHISVHHCAILIRKDNVVVRDFGSTNGTFVNDEKVNNDRELRNRDILRIGPLVLEVQLESATTEIPDVRGKKGQATVEKTAAKVMHEGSWSDIGDGILFSGPNSDYQLTEVKAPPPKTERVPEQKPDSKAKSDKG